MFDTFDPSDAGSYQCEVHSEDQVICGQIQLNVGECLINIYYTQNSNRVILWFMHDQKMSTRNIYRIFKANNIWSD